jgi:hypothetical protein
MNTSRQYKLSIKNAFIKNRGFESQSIDNPSFNDSKKNSLHKESSRTRLCLLFHRSKSFKVITIIGVITAVCLIVGCAAGLAYYLGTLGKVILKFKLISFTLYISKLIILLMILKSIL